MEKEMLHRIRDRMKETGVSNEEMAARIGSHPITVSKLLNGRMRMTTVWLGKFATALNADPSIFMVSETVSSPPVRHSAATASEARQLPVYGLAAGSLAGQAVMLAEPIEYVPAPPALVTVRDAYALTVTGTSMEPRYFSGDLIFIHPHKPVRPGDHVVVQVRKDPSPGGLTETWIKRFKADTDGEIVTEQYNPRADMRFKRQYVAAMHRVLTVNELLGV